MSILKNYFLNLTLGVAISLLLVAASAAATKFYLVAIDGQQKMDCDYLEIKNRQAICTFNSLSLTFDLAQVKNIQMTSGGKSYQINKVTIGTAQRINEVNASKITSEKGEQKAKTQVQYSAWTPRFVEGLSYGSFSELTQSLKVQYNSYFPRAGLNMILCWSGFIVFMVGNIWFLITAFRVGFLWGLSCILLPLVPFVFLFLHRRVAAKPFFVSILGGALLFGAVSLPGEGKYQALKKTMPSSRAGGQKVSGQYKCGGKVYCSEMTSCAEAKFYLRNCPGTKMDGNNDGVPCEKQWCGN